MTTSNDEKEIQKYIKEYSPMSNKILRGLLKQLEHDSYSDKRLTSNKITAVKTLLL